MRADTLAERTGLAIARNGGTSVLAALGLILLGSRAALGQAVATDSTGALEEVVVTARHTTEALIDVPISIAAFSGDDLQARNIEDLADVARFSPNLQFDGTAAVSGSTIASTVFIRGIGQTDFTLNSDPGVGVYVDGVYVARSVGSLLDLIDIQSVEVLRGPQGTLFGKNTIGGALNITSQRPSSEASGYLEMQGGNFDRRNIKARFDAPLSDSLTTSLSFASLNEEGYQQRILQPNEEDLGDIDRIVARGRAIWSASDSFEADVIVDYSRGREQSVPQSVLVIEPNTGAPFLGVAAGLNPSGLTTLRPQFAGRFTGADLLDGSFITGDPRKTYYGGESRSDFDIFGVSVTLSWTIGDVDVKSISAYREVDSDFARDSLSSPFVVADTIDQYDQKQWSQELRLSGTFLGSRGSYIAGLYYLAEEGTNSNLVATSLGDLKSGGSVDNESAAAFAQFNFDFSDIFAITAGVRYTDEQKGFSPGFEGESQRFETNTGLGLPLPPVIPLIADGDYQYDTDQVDTTVALQVHFTPDLLTYASYSTGFKAGGFSQRIGPGPGNPIPAPSFRPEDVKVYELGTKWLGLNGRLRITAAAFFTDYEDVQITPLFEGIGPVTRNAGEAEIRGGEFEWAFIPDDRWEFTAGIGVLHTEYKALTDEAQANRNLDGSRVLTLDTELAKSPDWSANASLAHHWDVGRGSLTARVDWSYTSELFNDVLNSEELARDELNLLGASLGFASGDGLWDLSIRGTNLTDEEYIIAGNAERYVQNIGYTQATYARPREWWIALRRNF
jgi:iron complex outermembrane receptor protein